MASDKFIESLKLVASYLNQNDLRSLSVVCKEINSKIVRKQLYKNIIILKDPIIRTTEWYIETNKTYLSGYHAISKTDDQNDMYLYDKIQRLLIDENLKGVKSLKIANNVFNDKESGTSLLITLIEKIIEIGTVRELKILDPILYQAVYTKCLSLTHLTNFHLLDLNDIIQLQSIHSIKSFTVNVSGKAIRQESIEFTKKYLCNESSQLVELKIIDDENVGLRFFDLLEEAGVELEIKYLKFNHRHAKLGYCPVIEPLSIYNLKQVVNLSNIKTLDISVGCEFDDCDCLSDFFTNLAMHLKHLQKLALRENTSVTQGDHDVEENWDILIGKFLNRIPNVSKNLKELSIRHNPPSNGDQKNSVDGNYFRRRDLYKEILPSLSSLEKLSSPSLLLNLSCYDILIGDLLWNGCTCEYCLKILPILDNYVMQHLHYSEQKAAYSDISVTEFFAYINIILNSRFSDQIESDLEIFSSPPMMAVWDFHGFNNIRHFDEYDCKYNETTFPIVPLAVEHFFNGYMDYLVEILPSLRVANFSGIYYQIVPHTRDYLGIYN